MGFGTRRHRVRQPRLRAESRATAQLARRRPRVAARAGRRAACSTWAAATARSARALRGAGHDVTGVDIVEHDGVGERRRRASSQADLDEGCPPRSAPASTSCSRADVLEHVREPERLLAELAGRARRRRRRWSRACRTSAHWYPRLRVARAVRLRPARHPRPRPHLRFFTRPSFERLRPRPVRDAPRGPPACRSRSPSAARQRQKRPTAPRRSCGPTSGSTPLASPCEPTLFAYQWIFELQPR